MKLKQREERNIRTNVTIRPVGQIEVRGGRWEVGDAAAAAGDGR